MHKRSVHVQTHVTHLSFVPFTLGRVIQANGETKRPADNVIPLKNIINTKEKSAYVPFATKIETHISAWGRVRGQ